MTLRPGRLLPMMMKMGSPGDVVPHIVVDHKTSQRKQTAQIAIRKAHV
jgi:hypothetical protein